MGRRLTTDQIESIWSNRLLTRRDNAKRANCSVGMVAKILAGVPPEQAPALEPIVAAEPDAVIVAEQLVAGGGSSEVELRRRWPACRMPGGWPRGTRTSREWSASSGSRSKSSSSSRS